jgi:hypothetical protein
MSFCVLIIRYYGTLSTDRIVSLRPTSRNPELHLSPRLRVKPAMTMVRVGIVEPLVIASVTKQSRPVILSYDWVLDFGIVLVFIMYV